MKQAIVGLPMFVLLSLARAAERRASPMAAAEDQRNSRRPVRVRFTHPPRLEILRLGWRIWFVYDQTVDDSGVPAIAGIAGLIVDPARADVLTARLAGRALSATEGADVARVTKSTMSVHLEKLLRAGLVTVEPQGRHKHFRLSHPDVARALVFSARGEAALRQTFV
jgi:DNA-binding transcriptional ArsR family regulator